MRVKGKRVLKNGMEAGYVYYSKEKKWKWRIIGKAKKSKRVQKGGTNEIKELYNRLKTSLSENKAHGLFSGWKNILNKNRSNINSIEDILTDVNEIYDFLYKRHNTSGIQRDYTKKCWNSIMDDNYNPNNRRLGERERKRCDILNLVIKIKEKEKEIVLTIIDKLVFNITKVIDNSLKKKEGVTVINADKLARIKYYVIKNGAPNFYNILKKLSERQYYYLYDNLKYKHQYMSLLQITNMTENFKLNKINKELTNQNKINNIISNIKQYISYNFADIKFLCNYVKIKCNKNNIEPPRGSTKPRNHRTGAIYNGKETLRKLRVDNSVPANIHKNINSLLG